MCFLQCQRAAQREVLALTVGSAVDTALVNYSVANSTIQAVAVRLKEKISVSSTAESWQLRSGAALMELLLFGGTAAAPHQPSFLARLCRAQTKGWKAPATAAAVRAPLAACAACTDIPAGHHCPAQQEGEESRSDTPSPYCLTCLCRKGLAYFSHRRAVVYLNTNLASPFAKTKNVKLKYSVSSCFAQKAYDYSHSHFFKG